MAVNGVSNGAAAGAGGSSPLSAAANDQLSKDTFLKLVHSKGNPGSPMMRMIVVRYSFVSTVC